MTRQLTLLLFGSLPLLTAAQSKHPNIIYIMCDDMGYGDLGCYGQKLIETPNLDRMAEEGMRFTQAYAGSPVSAPSRACFMTGQHAGHGHVRGNKEYWSGCQRNNMFGENSDYYIIGQEPYLLSHPIIPELFKQRGYNTGMFGKWAGGYFNLDHPNDFALDSLGNTDTSKAATTSSASLPHRRGIDVYYGPICQFQAHTYYPNFLNRYDPARGDTQMMTEVLEQNILHKAVNTGDADFENRTQYSADLIHRYALHWLDRQTSDKPFLGIFTYTLPHAELWQPNDSIVDHYHKAFEGMPEKSFNTQLFNWYYGGTDKHAQFAAMVTRLDAYVGEIMDKLKEKGFDENTLVIFTSDNGPHEEGGADPNWFNRDGLLQGKKRSTYEGGIRIPFIAKGPGVPVGTINDHQLAFYDLMPTFLEYAGFDARPYSMKKAQERGATDPTQDYYDGISFARTLTGKKGQKKHQFLYWEFHETNMMGLRMGDWKLVVNGGKCHLYDLKTDLHEDHDIIADHPKVAEKMKSIIRNQHVKSNLAKFHLSLPDEAKEK
ncbi:MAG: sulfatase-like hydrolase/transferase [Bacteroidales bacterium]|nr:sulfatase-like hydrolase/transferase [Candidatus Physcousia equi]